MLDFKVPIEQVEVTKKTIPVSIAVDPEDLRLSRKSAAHFLQVKDPTFYSWVSKGRIKEYRWESGKGYYILFSDLLILKAELLSSIQQVIAE